MRRRVKRLCGAVCLYTFVRGMKDVKRHNTSLFLSAVGVWACVRAGAVVKSPRYVLHHYSN